MISRCLTRRFSRGALTIAPAAVGCKRLLDRRATLRYHYESVGCSDRNARIVCTEA
jgi:hypothetical protein